MTTHHEPTYRIFTAFDLPREMNEKLYSLSKNIAGKEKGFKSPRPDNIHITLHFFAALEKDRIRSLVTMCEMILKEVKSFTLRVAGVGSFPYNKDPQIVWAGIDKGGEELSAIKCSLDKALMQQGFGVEKRKFIPHVTIGRVKYLHDQNTLVQRITDAKDLLLDEVEMKELHIIKSSLTQHGPHYETIRTIALL